MPTQKIITVFSFAELSDKDKEKARDKYRETFDFEYSAGCVIDDAKTIAKLFGLDIDRTYYSGFYHQGSGASFEGNYRYVKGALQAVKEHAPNDAELHRIVKALQDAQRRYFYTLAAKCESKRGHHLQVDVFTRNGLDEYNTDKVSDDIAQPLRDFASWIYSNLEREYEYQTSDDTIAEYYTDNEQEFTKDGELA